MSNNTKKKRRLYLYHFNKDTFVIETIERITYKELLTKHEYKKKIDIEIAKRKNIVWSETEPRV